MYILVAREILQGHLPYIAISQEKPLGAPMMVALAMGALGQSITAVRLLGFLVVATTCLVLRETAIAARLSRFAAISVSLLYAIFSTQLGGLATNTEILFAPFTAGAVWVAVAHVNETSFRGQVRTIATAGALFGLAIWCKYIPAFPACALFGVLVGSWLWRRRLGLAAAFVLAAIYAVACSLPTLACAAFYVWLGQWDAFWHNNIGFMANYVAVPMIPGLRFQQAALALIQVRFLLVLGGIGLALCYDAPAFVAAMFIWLVAESVAVVSPWKFFDHYFLLLLPPLCLLAGVAVDGFIRRLVRPAWRVAVARVPVACAILAPISVVSVLLVSGSLDIEKPDTARYVADFIRSDPEPGATAWVVNSEIIIYFLAGIPIPTPFIFTHILVGPFVIVARVDPEVEVRRILDTRPRYIVVDPNTWELTRPSMTRRILGAIEANYRLVKRVTSSLPAPVEVYKLLDPVPSAQHPQR